jgi:Zn-finger nucleic acid-binding protein
MAAVCPRCSVVLDHGKLGPAEVDLCPDCRGTLVEQKRLIALVEWMAGELLHGLDLDQEIEFVEDPGPVASCPACGGAMDRSGYMNMPQVLIDRCMGCRAVWLDVGELGAMSLIYARTERRSKERRRVMNQASAPLFPLPDEAGAGVPGGGDGALTAAMLAEAVIRVGFVLI